MKVVTAEEMRRIDQETIQNIGIPGIVLMENAGLGVICAIEKNFDMSNIKKISIFVGKGNNGGDGLVIARHLKNKGYDIKIYLLSSPDRFQGDALVNLHIAQNMGLNIETILSESDLEYHKTNIANSDLLIDAIFGTGLTGAVRGVAAKVISFINHTGLPVVAVDLPSGLDSDTGKIEGECIKAILTVTMGLPKRGLLLYPGAGFIGKLEITDIGIPSSVIESQGIKVNLIQVDNIQKLPKRLPDSHKGNFGRVLVLGGSVGLTGAAAMASESALRAGAGLVTLGIPKSLNPIMEGKLTEVMTLPLPETENQAFSKSSFDNIMKIVNNFDVVAIGPGMSRDPETSWLVRELCKSINIPKIIDADGLNAISEDKSVLKDIDKNTIFTPHPGEMARLIDGTVSDVQSDRVNIAQRFAIDNNIIMILKGVPTVVAEPNGEVYLNTTGNPGLASGGTGDVLTGIIAGFIAQGLTLRDSAILGVYIHGLAGDMAAEELGEPGMIAGDVIKFIPLAIKYINGG